MFPVQNSISEAINYNGKDVILYGSDKFFINGFKVFLMERFTLEFPKDFKLLVIKVWNDITLRDSVYMDSQPNDSIFVVICPLHTMKIVKGLPGYEKAIFMDSKSSLQEFTIQLKLWLNKRELQSAGIFFIGKTKPRYLLNSKETLLISKILNYGKVSAIAEEQHISAKTLYSRLHKIYEKFEVKTIKELVRKIQILFAYGFLEKNDFRIID